MKTLEPDVFHNGMGDTEAVERFNSGGAIRQNADGSGRGNSRDRRISPEKAFGLQPTAFIGWERSSFLSELM